MTLGRCLIGLDKDTSLKLYIRAQLLEYGIVLLQYQIRWAVLIPTDAMPKRKAILSSTSFDCFQSVW